MLLSQLQQRLSAQVGHSNLLRLRCSSSARVLDCRQLDSVDKGLARQLLHTLINSKATLNCDFPDNDHNLYELLDKRIRRQAELAQRETGVHALWLGYPLLYLMPPDGNAEQAVLAPLLLWPGQISANLRKQGQLRIKRDTEAGGLRHNPLLWAWVRRHYQIQLPLPDAHLDWTGLQAFLQTLAESFSQAPRIDIDSALVSVPEVKKARKSPSLINAAVLGYLHWPNASLLADLQALERQDLGDSLLSGLLARQHPPPKPLLPPPPETDRFLVSDADFSQMQAVWQARLAPGLVIHGPPGTGKSQTIVNIIADSLAHQQRVLMVCQKQAALQVVHERLRDVGLGQLCLLVRDADSDRLNTFRDIRAQVEGLPTELEGDELAALELKRKQLAAQITRLETTLDKHAQAVHVPHNKLQISYREILAQSAALTQRFPDLRSLPSLQRLVEGMPMPQVDELGEQILNLGHLYAQADPQHNPWYQRQPDCRLNDHLTTSVKHVLDELQQRNMAHLELLEGDTPPLELPEKLAAFPDLMRRIIQAFPQAQSENLDHVSTSVPRKPSHEQALVKAWWRALRHCNQRVLQKHLDAAAAGLKLADTADVAFASLRASLGTGLPLDQKTTAALRHHTQKDLQKLARQAKIWLLFAPTWWRFVWPFYYSARKALLHLAAPQALSREFAQQLIQHIQSDQLLTRLEYCCQTLVPGFAPPHTVWQGEASQRAEQLALFLRQAENALHNSLWLREQEQEHPWLTPLFDKMMQNPSADWDTLQQQFEHSLQRLPQVELLLQSIGKLQAWLLPEALAEAKRLVREGKDLAPWLQRVARGLAQFPALLSLDAERQGLSGVLKQVFQALEKYEIERHQDARLSPAQRLDTPLPSDTLRRDHYGQWWEALLRFSALQSALARCHEDAPSLQALTPQAHADNVDKLAEALNAKYALEADSIRHTWLQAQVPLRARPWKRIFQLRASKQGAAKRMREAVAAGLDEGLLQLRPCWLTNPETAAQIFPLAKQLFDVVIFDEASQCPLEQALPVIHRGQRLVVCGDEKQLPPTGFFMAHLDEDESVAPEPTSVDGKAVDAATIDPYLLQAEDLLQAACGHLRETYLRVHYRSVDPVLINFSNQAFYHGLLEIPPTCNTAPSTALQFFAVEGVYDKRRNQAEAEQVLDRLRDYWLRKDKPPSLGVITFNQVQRDLIEDNISQLCQTDNAFASAYQREIARGADGQGEGFFVKNLENVQGDERDVIIFSTTFGKDKQGHFYRRFGPLGASGGERRLNVGITRAKRSVELLCSLPLHDITDPDALDDGFTPAAYLQLYLQYAQAVSDGDATLAHKILQRLGHSAQTADTKCQAPAALLQDIQTHLQQWGYETAVCVGSGSLGIDLAVRRPHHSFILGIECDGGTYFRERDNRLREIWRTQLLRQRGWQLHRIWSERWWTAKNAELEKLQKILQSSEC